MFSGLGTFLAGLFASNQAQKLALDGLRQISGLNAMTPQEQSQYILDYIRTTAHQSPVRRLIALVLTGLYALVVVFWIASAAIGYLANWMPALELAGAVRMFMTDIVVQPMNLVISFYFVTQIASKFGNAK